MSVKDAYTSCINIQIFNSVIFSCKIKTTTSFSDLESTRLQIKLLRLQAKAWVTKVCSLIMCAIYRLGSKKIFFIKAGVQETLKKKSSPDMNTCLFINSINLLQATL